MKNLLPIRVSDRHGLLCLRDGLVLVLFSKLPHAELAPHARAFLDGYLEMVGADRLGWLFDTGEHYEPLTSKKLARLHKSLTPEMARNRREEVFALSDAENEPGGFHLQYEGKNLEEEAPEERSYIEVWFPTEFAEQMGHAHFSERLRLLAGRFPFTSGYCSLAFNFENWSELAVKDFITKTAFRHPGLDIHLTMSTSQDIGEQIRGAYWLTFLGPEVLAVLGQSPDKLRAALGEGISVYGLDGSVVIQAGERPEVGDTNRKENLPLVRRVAKLLEPVTAVHRTGVFILPGVDSFVAWQRRHLD
ncbi:type VI immunity family protein [Archangium sp.]|uniref:type VI immunity family protein n=1 Tax=Archangium sp. TaxID=1872627 RepID=UPI002D3AAB50|nr:type VI immunity family protein [Archangium sp.]HYO51814.1 type VI immunity family protein [Archangium sp.]